MGPLWVSVRGDNICGGPLELQDWLQERSLFPSHHGLGTSFVIAARSPEWRRLNCSYGGEV